MICHSTGRTLCWRKNVGRKQYWQSMWRYSEFLIIPRALLVILLWGWKNGYMCLAAYETGFPSGWLPAVIYPHSACSSCHLVAVVSPGKIGRGKIVGSNAGWNTWENSGASRPFQLVYIQGNWAGNSEDAVFTQCHCFLRGCPLPKPHHLPCKRSQLLHLTAAIIWLASTSTLQGTASRSLCSSD